MLKTLMAACVLATSFLALTGPTDAQESSGKIILFETSTTQSDASNHQPMILRGTSVPRHSLNDEDEVSSKVVQGGRNVWIVDDKRNTIRACRLRATGYVNGARIQCRERRVH